MAVFMLLLADVGNAGTSRRRSSGHALSNWKYGVDDGFGVTSVGPDNMQDTDTRRLRRDEQRSNVSSEEDEVWCGLQDHTEPLSEHLPSDIPLHRPRNHETSIPPLLSGSP